MWEEKGKREKNIRLKEREMKTKKKGRSIKLKRKKKNEEKKRQEGMILQMILYNIYAVYNKYVYIYTHTHTRMDKYR